MRAFLAGVLLTSLGATPVLAAGVAYRFSRTLQATPGWTRVDIPFDVRDATKPRLEDLRILDGEGREVPYAVDEGHETAQPAALMNVESQGKRETAATIDRGTKPSLIDGLSVEVEGTNFLKPLTVEASDDQKTWGVVAQGSLFATPETRSTRIRFAPNGRRYLRLRFDDRNGDSVVPRRVSLITHGGQPLMAVPVEVRGSSTASGVSRSTLVLPASNLPIVQLRITSLDPAYLRHVRVFERVFRRGDVEKRLIGEGWIAHAPGREDTSVIPLCETASPMFELEVLDGDSRPLQGLTAEALVQPQHLLFYASASSYKMVYGAAEATGPAYDLTAALGDHEPAAVHPAVLGPAVDHGGSATQLRIPSRGAELDPAQWEVRRAVVLPVRGNLAYLDLDESGSSRAGDLRIIDSDHRQVPYLLESDATRKRESVPFAQVTQGRKTIVDLTVDPHRAIRSLQIEAGTLEYFSREVSVLEETRDQRGVTGERPLGSAHWERRPGAPAEALEIAVDQPSEKRLRIEVDNGDNAPLRILRVTLGVSIARINFIFRPGERLELLTKNPAATAPQYDLTMLSGVVLRSPAERATLTSAAVAEPSSLPRWFWAVAVVAGVILLAALARTLRQPPEPAAPAA